MPPSPLWHFSKNSSDLVAGSFPYSAYSAYSAGKRISAFLRKLLTLEGAV